MKLNNAGVVLRHCPYSSRQTKTHLISKSIQISQISIWICSMSTLYCTGLIIQTLTWQSSFS